MPVLVRLPPDFLAVDELDDGFWSVVPAVDVNVIARI